MNIRIYNTLTRKKELLRPLEANHVKLYVCGITSYDYCHIGHARSALVFDMIVRYLRYRGLRVTFVRNFTDIDDKIIKRAAEKNISAAELADRFIAEFYTDMELLGVLRPDLEPRATEHINEMVGLIQELIKCGLAYQVNSDVYFSVNGFPEYGSLSGRSLEDMQAGARIEINEQKKNPMDFVLWKGSKPGEPKWDSPWGQGRPGWHIECSAMSRKYLDETFDIHGGGKDLIFPHHENEIAQSVGASGKPLATIWIHHGFVTIRDEKMSKSLGNFLTIRDALTHYSAEVLRLFIFSTQYRNPLDFSETNLQEAKAGLERMYECLSKILQLPKSGRNVRSVISQKVREKIESFPQRFQRAMDNDFNTAQALGILFDAVKVLNKALRLLPGQPAAQDLDLLSSAGRKFLELSSLLGILTTDPVAYVAEKKRSLLAGLDITIEEVERLIMKRNKAREDKNWQESDAIRNELLAHNIELRDNQDGTSWEIRS